MRCVQIKASEFACYFPYFDNVFRWRASNSGLGSNDNTFLRRRLRAFHSLCPNGDALSRRANGDGGLKRFAIARNDNGIGPKTRIAVVFGAGGK